MNFKEFIKLKETYAIVSCKDKKNPNFNIWGAMSDLKCKKKRLKSESVNEIPSKPKMFSSTHYRLPTEEELEDIHNYPNLTAKEIHNGFGYTMIGKGYHSQENQKMIETAIQMLHEKYPDNKAYKEAVILAIAGRKKMYEF